MLLRVMLNREDLLTISVRQRGGQWRAVGPVSSAQAEDRNTAIFRALFDNLAAREKFRKVVRSRMTDQS